MSASRRDASRQRQNPEEAREGQGVPVEFGAIQGGREESNQGAVAEEKRSEVPERQQEQSIRGGNEVNPSQMSDRNGNLQRIADHPQQRAERGFRGAAQGLGVQDRVSRGNANFGGETTKTISIVGAYGPARNRDEGQPQH